MPDPINDFLYGSAAPNPRPMVGLEALALLDDLVATPNADGVFVVQFPEDE